MMNGAQLVKIIRKAVDDGHDVVADSDNYRVIRDSIGQYLIIYQHGDYAIGLSNRAGTIPNALSFRDYTARVQYRYMPGYDVADRVFI